MERQQARDLVHPGPVDPVVLYLQARHRSTQIWDGQTRNIMSTIHIFIL